MIKKKKIYLIGNIPDVISARCQLKFYRAQLYLSETGFFVINPLDRFVSMGFTRDHAMKSNLQDLMSCAAVYIMPCAILSDRKIKVELDLALSFNLAIINGILDVTSQGSDEITNEGVTISI